MLPSEKPHGQHAHHGSSTDILNLPREPEFETLALHGAQEPDPTTGSRALPLYQTCAYNFTDAADAASKFACK